MPSINEVWEQAQQANAHLAVLHNDMVQLNECCESLEAQATESNDWLELIHETLVGGFTAMTQRQDLTNRLLAFGVQQNETQICQLEQIAERMCKLVNSAASQVDALGEIEDASDAIEAMLAHAAPASYEAVHRRRELQADIEACCPPDSAKPCCTHEPCERPGRPKGIDKPKLAQAATMEKTVLRRTRGEG